MTKQAKLIVLAGVVGLDMANAQHAVSIAASVKGINNLDAFIEFCRDTKEGITFTTKTERLDTLATRFKRMEEEARLSDRRATGQHWIDEIVRKVDECRTVIKNERAAGREAGFRNIRIDGVPLFDAKQLNALASIGSTEMIIELSETGILGDKLMSAYMARIRKPKAYEQIAKPQQRIMSMVAASAQAMEG